jgi:UDP-N-acetylglucosamine 2-epimerase (non-hydrolysing)
LNEVLKKNEDKIQNSDVIERLGLERGNYIVVSAHREENIDLKNHFEILSDSLNTVAEKYNMPIIFSTHPRTKKRIESSNIIFNPLIKSIAPLGFFDYVKLQQNAYVVLSDSGTISEESAMMGFPAVSIRTSTERPEAVDAGTIVLGGLSKESMLNSIEITKGLSINSNTQLPWEYQITNTSERIVKVIQSYTPIINKVIWDK